MGAERDAVVVCGGSHLAAVGVLPTQAFPVLLARRLRASGLTDARVRTVRYGGDPGLAPGAVRGSCGVVVLLTRNMYGIPLLPLVRRALVRRLTGRPAADEGSTPGAVAVAEPASPPGLVRQWAADGGRWLLALAIAAAGLPGLPLIGRHHGRALDVAIAGLRGQGCRRIVLATPVPLPWRRYPGARWYQRAISRTIRRRAGAGVEVADAFFRLGELPDAQRMLAHDPFHLTVEGHRLLADEIFRALERLLASGVPQELSGKSHP